MVAEGQSTLEGIPFFLVFASREITDGRLKGFLVKDARWEW